MPMKIELEWLWAHRAGGLMEEDHWLSDPRFASDAARGDNRDAVCERMAEWTGERTTQACLDALQAANIPGAPVLSPQEALEHPHIKALGLMLPLAYPGLATKAPVAKVPLNLSDTPGGIRARAPELGEHTDEILGELGYDTSAIAALRDAGAI